MAAWAKSKSNSRRQTGAPSGSDLFETIIQDKGKLDILVANSGLV
jgi:hypothetical protein